MNLKKAQHLRQIKHFHTLLITFSELRLLSQEAFSINKQRNSADSSNLTHKCFHPKRFTDKQKVNTQIKINHEPKKQINVN